MPYFCKVLPKLHDPSWKITAKNTVGVKNVCEERKSNDFRSYFDRFRFTPVLNKNMRTTTSARMSQPKKKEEKSFQSAEGLALDDLGVLEVGGDSRELHGNAPTKKAPLMKPKQTESSKKRAQANMQVKETSMRYTKGPPVMKKTNQDISKESTSDGHSKASQQSPAQESLDAASVFEGEGIEVVA
jgi:hypothetical protein